VVGGPNPTESQPRPLANFPKLAIAWNNLTMAIEWQAPKGLYWIEGNKFIQSFQQLIQILCAGHPLSLLSS
jgi:hypothetical protein